MINDEKKLIEKLERLKLIEPDLAYLGSFKKILENRMILDQRFKPVWIFKLARMGMGFSLAVFLIASFGFGVVKATETIPAGTFLYPIKLVGERLQLSFQPINNQNSLDLRLKFASNRIKEVSFLESSGDANQGKIKDVLAGYNNQILEIQTETLRLSQQADESSLQKLLTLEKQIQDISLTLADLKQKSLNPEIYLEAEESSTFVEDFLSRRIFSFEIELKTFLDDKFVWQRLENEYLRIDLRKRTMFEDVKTILATALGTTAFDSENSRLFLKNELSGPLAKTYQTWIELDDQMLIWQKNFKELAQENDLQKVFILQEQLSDFESRLAEIEVLLK